jgi:hypothetical protein
MKTPAPVSLSPPLPDVPVFKPTDGLKVFQLHPDTVEKNTIEHFNHLVQHRNLRNNNGTGIQASAAVGDIDITPVQHSITAPTVEDMRCGALLREAPTYGWMGQQSSSGFCDLAPSILHYNWF